MTSGRFHDEIRSLLEDVVVAIIYIFHPSSSSKYVQEKCSFAWPFFLRCDLPFLTSRQGTDSCCEHTFISVGHFMSSLQDNSATLTLNRHMKIVGIINAARALPNCETAGRSFSSHLTIAPFESKYTSQLRPFNAYDKLDISRLSASYAPSWASIAHICVPPWQPKAARPGRLC